MNLLQGLLVKVCVAIAALCSVLALLFPAQSVAGQETKPVTLRSAGEQAVVYGKPPENSPPPKVIFARAGEGEIYRGWRSDMQIDVAPIEIDFADFKHLRGDRKAIESFDLGFAILHELCHAVLELRDPSAEANAAGDCENYVNRIRRELGMPERRQYAATISRLRNFPSGLTVGIAELIFAQTEPSREPESRAKTKTLFLTWNVRRVGSNRRLSVPPTVKQKAGAGVAAP